jgi:hypothetical protein
MRDEYRLLSEGCTNIEIAKYLLLQAGKTRFRLVFCNILSVCVMEKA